MLMGLNLRKYYIVIMLGPYGMMADLIQALGRAGRREESGGRGQSLLYCCWNKTDLCRNTSAKVIEFCNTIGCLNTFVHKHFMGEDITFGGQWCCNNCS